MLEHDDGQRDHREQIYEVIDFLNKPENLQTYIDDQKAIPCIEGDFTLDPLFDDIQEFLDEGKVIDYPDHSYPSGMACDASSRRSSWTATSTRFSPTGQPLAALQQDRHRKYNELHGEPGIRRGEKHGKHRCRKGGI